MKKKVIKNSAMLGADHIMIKAMQDAFYRKINPQREQEVMDSRLIFEDHNAVANLPEHGITKKFNPNRYMQSLGRPDAFFTLGDE